MRDSKFAQASPSAGFESVDTVIRDEGHHPHIQDGAPNLRVLSFSNGLEPQTTPNGHMIAPASPADREVREAPRRAPARHTARTPRIPAAELSAYRSFDLPAAAARGKIIVVFGCRGGAGATMLAVNSAAQLARSGRNVCVVDLDLQLGDVFVALDLEANTSISALAREAGNLDAAALRRRMVRHDSGVYCLSQTGRLDDVDTALAEKMPALLAMLQEHFDYVIVDGVRDFGDHALAAMDVADKIALVLTQDVQAVRRAARVAQLFRRLGYPDKKVHVVLNRHSPKAHVDEGEIERVLNLPVSACIRNDYPRMRQALDEGALLMDTARGSGVARDVERTARSLLSDPQRRERDADDKVGLFARLFGRGGR